MHIYVHYKIYETPNTAYVYSMVYYALSPFVFVNAMAHHHAFCYPMFVRVHVWTFSSSLVVGPVAGLPFCVVVPSYRHFITKQLSKTHTRPDSRRFLQPSHKATLSRSVQYPRLPQVDFQWMVWGKYHSTYAMNMYTRFSMYERMLIPLLKKKKKQEMCHIAWRFNIGLVHTRIHGWGMIFYMYILLLFLCWNLDDWTLCTCTRDDLANSSLCLVSSLAACKHRMHQSRASEFVWIGIFESYCIFCSLSQETSPS